MQITKKYTSIALHLGVAAVAYYGIFHLPFLFPSDVPVVSDSYVFGFNNRVAVLCCLVITAFLFLLRRLIAPVGWFVLPTLEGNEGQGGSMGVRPVVWMALINGALALGIYLLVPDTYFGEARYFLRRVELVNDYGLVPYRDFEFAYGPLLLYPLAAFGVLLGKLGVSLRVTCILFLLLTNLLCLTMLHFVVDRAEVSKQHRTLVFVLVSLSACPVIWLALNGWLRHLTPYASLVAVHVFGGVRSPSRTPSKLLQLFGLGSLATFVNLGLSPEVGIAFAAALSLYLAWIAFRVDRRYRFNLALHIVTLPLFLVLMSPAYLQSIINFLAGGNNFPVVPAVYILLYLAALFVLLPTQLDALMKGRLPGVELTAGLLTLNVAMLPGALGRCDLWHVALYGIGVFTLTLLGLAKAEEQNRLPLPAWRACWLAYALIFVVAIHGLEVVRFRYQFANYALEELATLVGEERLLEVASTLGLGRHRLEATFSQFHEKRARLADLQRLNRYPKLLSPVDAEEALERFLKASGRYVPNYYVDLLSIYNEKQVARLLADTGRSDYVLVPSDRPAALVPAAYERQRQRSLTGLYLYPFRHGLKRDPYDFEARLWSYLAKNFDKVDQAGGYDVLKRRSAEAP